MAIVDLQAAIGKSGKTARFRVVRVSDGQFWNQATTAAFEAYNASHYATANYLVSMTEVGATAYFRGTFPAGIATGTLVNIIMSFDAAAGTPVLANDEVAGVGTFWWDGTNLYPVAAADVKMWLGTAPATNTAGVPKVDLVRIDGKVTDASVAASSRASLSLRTMDINNPADNALTITSGGNYGIYSIGQLAGILGEASTSGGSGIRGNGGAAGSGILGFASGANSVGIQALASMGGTAMKVYSSSGAGFVLSGGANDFVLEGGTLSVGGTNVLLTVLNSFTFTIAGRVDATVAGYASGQAAPSAAAIAAAVLVTPAQKIVTDSSGRVTTSNPASGAVSEDLSITSEETIIE